MSSVAHTQKPFRDRWRPKERLVSQAPQTLRLRIDVLRSKPREVLLLSRDHAVSGQWIIAIGAADSANGWRRCPDRGRHVRLPKQAADRPIEGGQGDGSIPTRRGPVPPARGTRADDCSQNRFVAAPLEPKPSARVAMAARCNSSAFRLNTAAVLAFQPGLPRAAYTSPFPLRPR